MYDMKARLPSPQSHGKRWQPKFMTPLSIANAQQQHQPLSQGPPFPGARILKRIRYLTSTLESEILFGLIPMTGPNPWLRDQCLGIRGHRFIDSRHLRRAATDPPTSQRLGSYEFWRTHVSHRTHFVAPHHLKSRDITLLTKVCLVEAMVFPVVMYRCESWTIKKAELMLLNCSAREDSWESLGLQGDQTSPS